MIIPLDSTTMFLTIVFCIQILTSNSFQSYYLSYPTSFRSSFLSSSFSSFSSSGIVHNKLTYESKTSVKERVSDSTDHFDPSDILQFRRKNTWWPFKNSFNNVIPEYLDGTLAGDNGFDPLRLARNKENLFLFREAEYKHARLAMLAAIGWPSSELVHYQLMENQSPDTYDFRAPSVLNGGLDNEMVLFGLGLFFSIGAVLEYELLKRKEKESLMAENLKSFFDMWREDGWDVPGNYGFDPLKLGYYMSGNDNHVKLLIQTIEIFNGRVAMLAVVGYVVQEYITGKPVIYETPEFFVPLFRLIK